MAKRELVIKTYDGENGSKIFVLSQNITGLSEYQKAKVTESFINRETKVLEMAIETYLRQVLRENGVLPMDGSKSALERAFITLENNGKAINIYDRYNETYGERIIGQSSNLMTVIEEDGILSCAMEIEVVDSGR